jgi:ribosome biogenesis GTPase
MSKRRLSGQQKRRIHEIQQTRLARASQKAERRAASLEEAGLGPEQEGRVLVNFGNAVVVESDDGTLVRCHARQNLGPIACGDRIAWQPSHIGDGVVTAVAPRTRLRSGADRRSEISRASASARITDNA